MWRDSPQLQRAMNRPRLAAFVGIAGTLLGGGGLAAGLVVSGRVTQDINAGLYTQFTLPPWTTYPSYVVLLGVSLIFAALVLFYGVDAGGD